ncbi:MAG: hypothetical protein EAZ61_09965 [Oscillatoriales cyanobacterium]|nr:MAG: hypothetical protein EAZ61_09965 [Oscillatoriales cyanobacterium]
MGADSIPKLAPKHPKGASKPCPSGKASVLPAFLYDVFDVDSSRDNDRGITCLNDDSTTILTTMQNRNRNLDRTLDRSD